PQALAIDGNHAGRRAQAQRRAQGLGEPGQRRLQLGRIEKPKQATEAVMARRAVRQIDELAQTFLICRRETRNRHTVLRPAQRRSQRYEQHGRKIMSRIDVTRITDFPENRDDRLHPRPPRHKEASSESTSSSNATKVYSNAIPLPLREGVWGEGNAKLWGSLSRRTKQVQATRPYQTV